MEGLILEMGFESQDEFNNLICSVDLSSSGKIEQFIHWKSNDGTKSGLLKLIEKNKK